MGENGSGKSTLVKIFSGVHRPDGGQVLHRVRRRCVPRSPRAAVAAGVATVFQEVQCVPGQSVLDNLWLGTRRACCGRAGPRQPGERGDRRERGAAVLAELLGDCPRCAARRAGRVAVAE